MDYDKEDQNFAQLAKSITCRIHNRPKHPKNIREIDIALQDEWAQIPEYI